MRVKSMIVLALAIVGSYGAHYAPILHIFSYIGLTLLAFSLDIAI